MRTALPHPGNKSGGFAAVPLIRTLLQRRVRRLYVSAWYLFAALIWFPMLFLTAKLPDLFSGVERVPELLALVASARRVLRQNIGGAVIYNALAIPAALLGWVHPAVAAVAMAASSITVVVNSTRVRGSRHHRVTPIESIA